ncbi:MAG: type IV toxin-antitoxin system AbiEi family antitoxin [Chloroflexota bacterium]
MRQAEVQALFLQTFAQHYPQLRFRGIRRFPEGGREPFDLALRVSFGSAGNELDLLCVTLAEGFPQETQVALGRIRAADLRATAEAGAALTAPVVPTAAIVAPFVSEEAQTLCRRARVAFFDLAGNAYLDSDRVFLEIRGKPNHLVREREISAPFLGKAERVARRLLLEPNRRWNMRELAEASQVSLGMASMVTSTLADMGVILKSRRGVDLVGAGTLLDAWAEAYDIKRSAFRLWRSPRSLQDLMARLIAGREQLENRYALTLWSGALTLLGEPAVAPRLALYWLGPPEQLVRRLELSEGLGTTQVFVFQPYDEGVLWGRRETSQNLLVAHPIQLYLDLHSGDAGELRLARAVRERLLIW